MISNTYVSQNYQMKNDNCVAGVALMQIVGSECRLMSRNFKNFVSVGEYGAQRIGSWF
jgi:hypothetical protein